MAFFQPVALHADNYKLRLHNKIISALIKVINLMKSTYCIKSVCSFADINKSLTNNSKTKQTFSFSRRPRFSHDQSQCQKSTYGGDFVQHKPAGVPIGKSKRSDFTKCYTASPGSSKYNLSVLSDFEESRKNSRGSVMGLGRDKVIFNQYIHKEASRFPSATKYEFEKVRSRFMCPPSFSMRNKTKALDRTMTLDAGSNNPAPNSYNVNPEDVRVSKFQKISYGTPKSIRFESSETKVPGVGTYNDLVQMSKYGKYQNSKYRGGTHAKFDRTTRDGFINATVRASQQKPGPGYYRAPSEFGQYDGNVYGQRSVIRYTQTNSKR